MKAIKDMCIIIRGGGDLATGVAHRLHRSGFKVLILEVAQPLVVRRSVAFAQAVIDGRMIVEEITAVHAHSIPEIHGAWQRGEIPVYVDPAAAVLKDIKADAVVDATLAKRDTGMRMDMAPLTIALGPGFEAGKQVHVVIETMRGHNLGRLFFKGCALPDTGKPDPVMGYGAERVLRSPQAGSIRHVLDIGAPVKKDDIICYVNEAPVRAVFEGVVRGLIMNGREVPKGLKIGDVDPRPVREHCYTISDKARALGGSVLEAILYWNNQTA